MVCYWTKLLKSSKEKLNKVMYIFIVKMYTSHPGLNVLVISFKQMALIIFG